MAAIKVKAIIGSTSPTSYNLKVVNYMKKRYEDRLTIIPVLVNDIEAFTVTQENNPPKGARKFIDEVNDSEAVLFATPEYNYSVPGALKNALDWVSRGDNTVLQNKPSFIIGASMGVLGSIRAQLHLRDMLVAPNLAPKVLTNNEVYIGSVHEKVDESGQLTDQGTIDFLDQVTSNFLDFYQKETNKGS